MLLGCLQELRCGDGAFGNDPGLAQRRRQGAAVAVARHAVDGMQVWFVGHDSVEHSHYGRTFKDMRDRLMEGYDQRWAYITVSANLVRALAKDENGQDFITSKLDEEQTDRSVEEFVSELAPELLDVRAVKEWH